MSGWDFVWPQPREDLLMQNFTMIEIFKIQIIHYPETFPTILPIWRLLDTIQINTLTLRQESIKMGGGGLNSQPFPLSLDVKFRVVYSSNPITVLRNPIYSALYEVSNNESISLRLFSGSPGVCTLNRGGGWPPLMRKC